jgi:hypothetical protein
MFRILNEGQEQGLWETLASMTYPQILLIWLKIRIRQNAKLFHCYVRICVVQLCFFLQNN